MVTFTFIVDFCRRAFPPAANHREQQGGRLPRVVGNSYVSLHNKAAPRNIHSSEKKTRHSWPGSSCIGQSCSVGGNANRYEPLGVPPPPPLRSVDGRKMSFFFNALSNARQGGGAAARNGGIVG